ncbi:hypothetical protein KQX54_000192, partial [Cotesia glomerata]
MYYQSNKRSQKDLKRQLLQYWRQKKQKEKTQQESPTDDSGKTEESNETSPEILPECDDAEEKANSVDLFHSRNSTVE